jgi:hypothetical protein
MWSDHRCGQQQHALVCLWSTEARPSHYVVVVGEHFATLHEIGDVLCRCDSVSSIAKVRVTDLSVVHSVTSEFSCGPGTCPVVRVLRDEL